jgi:hypothetical protein
MGSDDRQCYNGDRRGIVGITLHVQPIAYGILFNRRALRHYVQRDQVTSMAEQIAGSKRKRRSLPEDENLAAILEEIEGVVYSPAYERRRRNAGP